MDRPRRRREARLIGAFRRDRHALLVTTALTAAVVSLLAFPARGQIAPDTQPTGGAVVAGTARIAASPTTTTVTQSSGRAAVNWQTFNVGSAATVDFVQPSANAVTLNRVIAADPSLIAGHIHANGGIVITNQAGVVFTHGSEVNAASVLVSAAGITNRNFMAGRMQFDIPAKPGARIVNDGRITVRSAGLAALVAPEVANAGVITARLGHVILAGGAATETLDLYGDGLVSLDVTPEAHPVRLANGVKATALVTNTGTIIASGGTVELTARQADDLVQDLVDAGGTIAANSVGAHTGTIAISGIGGSIRIPGTLLAEGKAPGTTGGAIVLDATGTVTLPGTARVDASGSAGGGTVAVGTTLARARGGPGTTAALTAGAVRIAPRAWIDASAANDGDGGHVTVLSLDTTSMSGTIRARGGRLGGNGGSVEISGENLSLVGHVDTSAPLGTTGSILLDPYNLMIVASGTNNGDVTSTGVAFNAGGTATGDTDTVSAGVIQALSGNVTLQAINNLEIATSLTLNQGTQSLLLEAGNNVTIDPGVLVFATGNIEMDAASSIIPGHTSTGALLVEGTVQADGNVTLSAGSGGITINTVSGPTPASVIGSAVVLNAPAGLVDDSGGAITATSLSGTSAGARLTGSNSIGTLASFNSSAGGTFNLQDKSALTVTGQVIVPSDSSLEISADSLTLATGSSLVAPTGSVFLNGGAGSLAINGDIGGSPVPASLTLTADGPILAGDGTLNATTLSGSSAGANLTGINNVATLANFTSSGGAFSLSDQQDLLITGAVSAAGNTVTLTINNGGNLAEQQGGIIIAGTLAGSAGSASLNGGNEISSLGGFTLSNGGLSLTNAEPLGITGTVSAVGNIVTLTINNGGNLAEQPGGSITAGTLAGSAAGVDLGEPNTVGTLGIFTSTGNFTLTETIDHALTINGEVSASMGGTISLTADGITIENVLLTGSPLLPNGTVVLAPASTLPIALLETGTANAGTLSLNNAELGLISASALRIGSGNAGSITISGLITLPTDIALLDLVSSGTASETKADSISVGTLTANVTSASLMGNNEIGTLGDVTATGGFTLTDAENLTLAGLLDAGSGTAQLNDPLFAITEQGGSITAGTFSGSGASASLAEPNHVGALGAFAASSGGFSFVEAPSQNLLVTGSVSVPSGQVLALTADGLAIGPTGSLSAAGATVTLASATSGLPLDLTTDLVTAQTGTFSLGSTFPHTAAISAGTLIVGAGNGGAMTVTGSIGLPATTELDLLSSFIVSETTADSLGVGTLAANVASASLIGSNQIGTLGNVTATGGGFSLVEAVGQTLFVTGAVSVPIGQTIALTTDGFGILGGSLNAAGGTVKLAPASVGQQIALLGGNGVDAGTLSINDSDLGLISASTLQIGSATAGAILIGNPGDLIGIPNTVTSLVFESDAAITESGSLIAPFATLSGFALSASLPAPGNTLAELGNFTATGGFTLTNAGNLLLAGPLDAGAATADLTSISGSIQEVVGPPAGTIAAGTLDASAANAIALSEANSIATLGDIAAPGGFTLDNPAGFFIAGNLDAGSATVLLASAGAAVENGGSITAGVLSGTLAAASLGGANAIADLTALTAKGGLSLTNEEALTITGTVDIGHAFASFAINGAGLSEIGAGLLTAGLIEGSAGSVSLPNGANAIGTLGAFSAPGGLELAVANGLAIAGVVDTGAGGIDLLAHGGIAEIAGGTLIGGELFGFAGSATQAGAAGVASFTNTNTVTSLGDFTALGGFSLADTGSLALLGALNAGAANVALTGGAAVSEPSGTINATTLSGTLASAALGGGNRIDDLISFTVPGGFSLTDLEPLTLTGPVSAGNAEAAFFISGNLAQNSASILTAGTLAGTAATIDLANAANAISSLGAITAPGGLTVATATGLAIGGSVNTSSAPIVLSVAGDIGEIPGGTLIAGALTGSASAASFANTNSIGELGNFTAPGGFTLDNEPDLALAGLLNAGSATALLVTGGSLFETNAVLLGETTVGAITAGTLTGSAGAVTLGDAANRIANLGSFTATAFNLTDGENLTVMGPVAGNPIGLVVNGNLSIGGGGAGLLTSAGPVFLTVSGAITEPNGAIDAASLSGSSTSASLGGANLVPLLDAFTTKESFFLNADEPTLTVNGPLSAGQASLVSTGSLVLAGLISSGATTLSAGGPISETTGLISTGILVGTAPSVTLTAANTIDTLGSFSTPGTFLLTDSASLAVAGPVTAEFLGIDDTAAISFTGSTNVGTLSVTSGGSITEPSGLVAASLLEGSASGLAQFGPDAPAGSASITTLGPFSVAAGTFTLTDLLALTIRGPLDANYFAITAPGSIVLMNATITTLGLPPAEQAAPNPTRPGSFFSVTTPGGRFLELGRTTINPAGGTNTVRIQLDQAGGVIEFADLVAPTTNLILDTGAGTAIGTIDLGALFVVGNLGSSTLTGMIANLSGLVASSKATISPFQSPRYRLNACPLMSVNCIFIAPEQVPQGNPLSGIAIISAPPSQREIDLLLPNVAAQDY